MTVASRSEQWVRVLASARGNLRRANPLVAGRLTRIVGLTLEAVGCRIAIGGRCMIERADRRPVEAEVVGFSGDRIYLMPTGDIRGLVPNARVVPSDRVCEAPVGAGLLGRVLSGAGAPIDGRGALNASGHVPLTGHPINPMARDRISQPLDVGVQAVNALLTVGRGQRMGLFAGSGVGKSVLLGMMTRFSSADVIVVGLIGERGREVKEFIERTLGEAGMARAVVVASPADDPPLLRIHGAWVATAIAEHFRDQGKHVLLLMDSLTRFAQAQREVALAVGEPPATKGYPPSVFAKLPQLVERAGNGAKGQGSITAFYTVLAEGDDQNDPIADAVRAILDGHVVLSRRLAEAGHYPAIDIEASISRTMNDIVSPDQLAAARRFKRLYSTYEQNRDLINIGAYTKGTDKQIDEAIAYYPKLMGFLNQDLNRKTELRSSVQELASIVKEQGKPVAGAVA
jgi:flagellum-specific ATP synthase